MITFRSGKQRTVRLNAARRRNLSGRSRQIAALSALAALIVLLLDGCAARMSRSVDAYVHSVIAHGTAPSTGVESEQPRLDDPPVFSFRQASQRAARVDRDVARALADAAQSQIDLAQDHSRVWPRLDVRTYIQVPFGGGVQGVQTFSGGLFFRYDLQLALFSRDASAMAQAQIDASHENAEMASAKLAHDLFVTLADREAKRIETAQRSKILDATDAAQKRAHELARIGRLKPEQLIQYQAQYESAARLYRGAVDRLQEINREICNQLFTDCSREVEITDFSDLLSRGTAAVPAAKPDAQAIQAAWDQRHDTRSAADDLFVKEMTVIAERRKRIPVVSPSFGLGSMALTSSFNQSTAVMQLGITMPLLDFGDIKRAVSKAVVERDLARGNIAVLVLRTQREVQDSTAALAQMIAARESSEEQREVIARQTDASDKLISAGVLDPLEGLDLSVRRAEAEIDAARARIDVAKAAVDYAQATGCGIDSARGAPASGAAKE